MSEFADTLLMLPGFIVGLTVHEFSHAWVAHRLGDSTARSLGRLTLNPLKHLDFFGTMMLVFVGFGWAKPVPVNMQALKYPRRDMALIALAGPVSNLLIAMVVAALMHISLGELATVLQGAEGISLVVLIAVQSVFINVVLAIFNLIPLPPLDGSRILAGIVPASWNHGYEQLERYGPFLLLGLFLLASFTGISIFGKIISPVVRPIVNLLLNLEL